MQLTVSLLPNNSLPPSLVPAQTTAVVVDVLRATSVMATALNHRAARIVTFEAIEEAVAWADEQAQSGERPLLCGERHCQPIAGFDLGNSPSEYPPQRVAGKTLVVTTTNGTRALAAAAGFQHILTASFLNLSAALARVAGAPAVHLICAGTDGHITAEDTLLAGAFASRCVEEHAAQIGNDEARLAVDHWSARCCADLPISSPLIADALLDSQGGRNLARLGMADDVRRCAQVDTHPSVPTVVARQPITLQ
ncbi:2-phosphosulfolactate phosphatase [Roseimaritima ulvae]|nr:2-phosphosulfolactate phosphatase [Roseimaritima ulvae]